MRSLCGCPSAANGLHIQKINVSFNRTADLLSAEMDKFGLLQILISSSHFLGSPRLFFAQESHCFTFSTNVVFSYICKNHHLISRCLVNRFPVSAFRAARPAALNSLH